MFIAAYVLLVVAVIASAALFGVQYAKNRELEAKNEELHASLEEQITSFQVQIDDLKGEIEDREEKLTQNERQFAILQEKYAQVQEELQNALRYTLDVRDCDPGEIIAADSIDWENLGRYFASEKIEEDDAVYQRIYGKSYVENDDIGLDELRYLKVLHYNFDHEIQVGELIVNHELVADYQEIFQELFENGYEINSMYLIDNYWTGDGVSSDSASIEVNNTSAFCYRRVVGGSGGLSNHALGRAIDINPQQNPYVTYKDGKAQWSHDNADDYIERDSGLPHVITHDDLCYRLFKEHGFDWGGDWKTVKDYQHFDKEE